VNASNASNVCTAASGCRKGADDGSAGALAGPSALAIAPDGSLFVSDASNHRIDVFSRQGSFSFAFGKEVNAGQGDPNVCTSSCKTGLRTGLAGGLAEPVGSAFDGNGNFFVAGPINNRIDVFNRQGGFLYAFAKEVNAEANPLNSDVCTGASGCKSGIAAETGGALRQPTDVKVAPNDQLVVGDFGSNRIDVFTKEGGFVRAFGKDVSSDLSDVCTVASQCRVGNSEPPGAGALSRPGGVAVGTGGEIYVADQFLDRIDQFTFAGGFVRAFGGGVLAGGDQFEICTAATGCLKGSRSVAPGSIPEPFGIALDCRGALYAGVSPEQLRLSRITRFGEPGTAAPPCPPPMANPPSNKFKFLKVLRNKKRGTATLVVEVPGAGDLLLRGKGLKTAKRSVKAAGRIRLPVKPIGKARRKLAKRATLRLKARVTFTPVGGTAATMVRPIRLLRR
jgi:hypothetical protein